MSNELNAHRIGWIGVGRMGSPMAERLLKAGHAVHVWNRTRAKAEPLAAKGATLVDRPSDLSDVDILFTMVSTAADVEAVLFGKDGVIDGAGKSAPRIVVDCSSIGADESADIRSRVEAHGRGVPRLARKRQRQDHQGRQAQLRRLRSARRLRRGEALSGGDRRQRRCLCR